MRASRILRGCSAVKEQLVDVVQMLPLVELLGNRYALQVAIFILPIYPANAWLLMD